VPRRFRALAEEWQRDGRPFIGLLFGHQLRGTIGQYVEDLELVCLQAAAGEKTTDKEELGALSRDFLSNYPRSPLASEVREVAQESRD